MSSTSPAFTATDTACAAKVGTSGIGMSAVAMFRFANIVGEQTPEEVVLHLRQHVEAVAKGDLGGVEAMLVDQAIALQAISANLVNRAALNLGEHLGAVETYMKLGLKAQAQSRATIETLATIKNRPVVHARQANFAAGNQQVNNEVRAREIESEQDPLLEDQHGERLKELARLMGKADEAMKKFISLIVRPFWIPN